MWAAERIFNARNHPQTVLNTETRPASLFLYFTLQFVARNAPFDDDLSTQDAQTHRVKPLEM
jgi:hypothetical protein